MSPNFWGCRCCGRQNRFITHRLIDSSGNVVWSVHGEETGLDDGAVSVLAGLTPDHAATILNDSYDYRLWALANGSLLYGPSDVPVNGSSQKDVVDDGSLYVSALNASSFQKVDKDASSLWTQTTPAHGTSVNYAGSSTAVIDARGVIIRTSPDYANVVTSSDMVLNSAPTGGGVGFEIAEWDSSGSLLWSILATKKNTGSATPSLATRWIEYDQSGDLWVYCPGASTDPSGVYSGNIWKISGGAVVSAYSDSDGVYASSIYGSDSSFGIPYGSTTSQIRKFTLSTGVADATYTLSDGYNFIGVMPAVDQVNGLVYIAGNKSAGSGNYYPTRLYCFDLSLNLLWKFDEASTTILNQNSLGINQYSAIDGYVFVGGIARPRTGFLLS